MTSTWFTLEGPQFQNRRAQCLSPVKVLDYFTGVFITWLIPFMVKVRIEAKRPEGTGVMEERADKVVTICHAL